MTTEDWRQIGDTQWLGPSEKNYLLEINSYIKPPKWDKPSSWDVKLWTITEDIVFERKFKSHSLALIFAKQYMRTH